jgi:cation diffusion facilitator family transporter
MNSLSIDPWKHDHSFGQQKPRPGERRTRIVVAITLCTMVIEITAGLVFGSMALLADGLHMASHAVALGLSSLAYIYARRRADDARFSFGTGKVNALAGFTGAVLLVGFASIMAIESFGRFLNPVVISYDYAIVVAVLGLVVNGICVVILGGHGHDPHKEHSAAEHGHHDHEDHNLRSAYLHVLADALTSFLAIFALLAGKVFGKVWLDPIMGIVGALLVANWSRGLIRQTGRVLLDRQGPAQIDAAVRSAIEADSADRVSDLHVWSIGPGIYAAEIALVSETPRQPDDYKALLPDHLGLVHVTVEVHRRS